MELSYNPYIIFASSTTPAGLYARQKWLNQELTPQWKADFQRCAEAILEHQTPEGSWKGSAVETIRHLFGVHLTIREANREIDNALDWLMERAMDALKGRSIKDESLSSESLRALPFTPCSFNTFLINATLFLSSIFGREEDAYVFAMYEWQANAILTEEDRPPEWGSLNNMLRAFVVHPMYSMNLATEKLVTKLDGAQEESGRWGKDINPYQTVNALAHLDMEEAESQVEKAFEYLAETQNDDGTWGETDREWNTFLVVHAMRKKGVLE
jgi:hypothetical protein